MFSENEIYYISSNSPYSIIPVDIPFTISVSKLSSGYNITLKSTKTPYSYKLPLIIKIIDNEFYALNKIIYKINIK